MRWPVNLSHGGVRGLAVAAATEVAGTSGGDHAIAVAVITASSGLVAVLLSQMLSRRGARSTPDHIAEASAEHADLSERLLAQLEAVNESLAAKDAEIITLRKELDRERRRHG